MRLVPLRGGLAGSTRPRILRGDKDTHSQGLAFRLQLPEHRALAGQTDKTLPALAWPFLAQAQSKGLWGTPRLEGTQ